MELRVLEESKDTLKMEIISPDDTVIHPLVSVLLSDKRVVDARYISGHPQLDKPTLLVKVKEGKPRDVLKEVAQTLATEYGKASKTLADSEAAKPFVSKAK